MNLDITYIGLVLCVILLSMTLHEAMHAYASYWLGDMTAKREGRLTLNPFRHIDPFLTLALPITLALIGAPIFGGAKPVPFNPYNVRYGAYGVALVGIAGPLTNLLLAFIFYGVYALTGAPGGLVGNGLYLAIIVNLGFFIFNMIPIPPLDGSRVLYAIAPDGIRELLEYVERYGVFIVLVVVMLAAQPMGEFIMAVQQILLNAFGAVFGVHILAN